MLYTCKLIKLLDQNVQCLEGQCWFGTAIGQAQGMTAA